MRIRKELCLHIALGAHPQPHLDRAPAFSHTRSMMRAQRLMRAGSSKRAAVGISHSGAHRRLHTSLPSGFQMDVDRHVVWEQLQQEAVEALHASDDGFGFKELVRKRILAHDTMGASLSSTLKSKLLRQCLDFGSMSAAAYEEDPTLLDYAAADLHRWLQMDPAAGGILRIFLFFKGFHSVQCARVSHHYWHRKCSRGATSGRMLALALQSEMSDVFGVDIHPASKWGYGITMDHGGGCVVGETAVIGDNVYLMHDVTLGATGTSDAHDRHPKIGRGAFLAAKCTVLGNITVGPYAIVGAHALVTKPVPAGHTAVGVPAKIKPPFDKLKVSPGGAILDDAFANAGDGIYI